MNEIPHIIHYCWFGRNPLPQWAKAYIDSWRRYFPGWEIKEWNEDNFDVNACLFTRQAYAAGKYAFVSDYARFAILLREGGVYFDTDVEVLRDISPLLGDEGFIGFENEQFVTRRTPARTACRTAPSIPVSASALCRAWRFIARFSTATRAYRSWMRTAGRWREPLCITPLKSFASMACCPTRRRRRWRL